MTKTDFIKYCRNSFYDERSVIVLFLHMPSGEVEVIINSNIPAKIDYVLSAYDENMKHKNNSGISIEKVRFVNGTKLLNYLFL